MDTRIAKWTKKWAENTNHNFLFYTQTTSTNDIAKQFLPDKPSKYQKMLFITQSQTKGRGQKNRAWIDSNFMVSYSYSLTQAPQVITTSLMGLALYTALKKTWDYPFKIKLPNDIYINNKKIAGLLIEVVNKACLHQLIIGVGINVFTHPNSSFSTNLQKHIKTEITEKQWNIFLTKWHNQIHRKIKYCTELTLRTNDKKMLQNALYIK